MFDPDQFMNQETDGEMSTDFIPVPEGEFQALISAVNVRSNSTDKGEFVILDINWTIDDHQVSETTGMENPSVRQSIFLDVTESGGLDLSRGKNIQLGRLRAAVGQNGPGAWSPSQLEGNVAMVRVAHRMYEDRIFADVKGVNTLN